MNKNEQKCVLCGAIKNEKPIVEYTKESFITAYMIKTLSQPYTEMLAYKNGLIDENGNQIKKPITIEEKNSLTALDSYIIKIKKLLGNKIDILNHSVFLEAVTKTPVNLTTEEYHAELLLKNELKYVKMRLDECINLAKQLNIPKPIVEKLILESLV